MRKFRLDSSCHCSQQVGSLGFLESVFTPTYIHHVRIKREDTLREQEWQDMRDEPVEQHAQAEPDPNTLSVSCVPAEAVMNAEPFDVSSQASLARSVSLEQQQKQTAQLLTRVREMDIRSVKVIQALNDIRRDLEEAKDRTEHVKRDTSALVETCSEQFTCQLESVNRSIEEMKYRVENQMLTKLLSLQEAVNSHAFQLLRIKRERPLPHGDTGSGQEHVEGSADTGNSAATSMETQQAIEAHSPKHVEPHNPKHVESKTEKGLHEVDCWFQSLHRTGAKKSEKI